MCSFLRDFSLPQAYKFDPFSTTCFSGLVEPSSFCHKAGNFKEIIEFLESQRRKYVAFFKIANYFCGRYILISLFL